VQNDFDFMAVSAELFRRCAERAFRGGGDGIS
jgi:hypothetical protein